MHTWGDKDVDWDGINKACRFIGLNLLKWGRVEVRDYKEKYGTIRVYCSLGWWSLHSITHPGHVYIRYKNEWLKKFCYSKINRFIFKYLNKLVIPYHKWLYRFLYKRACEKWPHLTEEIMCMADFHELLDGLVPRYELIKVIRSTMNKRIEYLQSQIDSLEKELAKVKPKSADKDGV